MSLKYSKRYRKSWFCFSILKQNCIAKHWIDCLQSGELFRKEVNIELFFVTSMCTCMSENNMPLIWRVWGILLYTPGWFCWSDRRNVCPIDNWRTLGPTYCKLRLGWASCYYKNQIDIEVIRTYFVNPNLGLSPFCLVFIFSFRHMSWLFSDKAGMALFVTFSGSSNLKVHHLT